MSTREIVMGLLAQGFAQAEAARRSGVSKSRVGQIVKTHAAFKARQEEKAAALARVKAPRALSDLAVQSLLLSIDYIPLTVRAYNVIRKYRITCLGEIAQLDRRALAGAKGIGRVTIEELSAALRERDLDFGEIIPNWASCVKERSPHPIALDERTVRTLDAARLRDWFGLP